MIATKNASNTHGMPKKILAGHPSGQATPPPRRRPDRKLMLPLPCSMHSRVDRKSFLFCRLARCLWAALVYQPFAQSLRRLAGHGSQCTYGSSGSTLRGVPDISARVPIVPHDTLAGSSSPLRHGFDRRVYDYACSQHSRCYPPPKINQHMSPPFTSRLASLMDLRIRSHAQPKCISHRWSLLVGA